MTPHGLDEPVREPDASRDAGSGDRAPVARQSEGPARRYSWRTFWEGNAVATKHGARFVKVPERAMEIAEHVRDELEREGLWRDTFAPTVISYGIVRTRIERASAAIGQVDDAVDNPLGSYVGEQAETVERLRTDLRQWLSLELRYAAELGLTPAARGRIARDTGVAQATRTTAALRALNEHLDREGAES